MEVAIDMHVLMGASGGKCAVVVDKCGHLSPLECPQEVAGGLIEWLSRVDAANGMTVAHGS